MFEKLELTLKIVCLALGLLLAAQVSRFALARDPLKGLKIPQIPALAAPTNAPAGNSPARAESPPSKPASVTNAAAGGRGTAGAKPPTTARNPPPGRPRGGPVAKPAGLPPEIQARVDGIVDSELLGPVIHPVPMGLLGIAGNVAMLRATNGQTGMVKEGDEMGGIKLLRIGTNRVLVETDGQKQELTLFNGLGGETLLQKTKENTP